MDKFELKSFYYQQHDAFGHHSRIQYYWMKVLFVCLGNICRSPLAQGILEEKTRERGLDWEVDSAGTGSWHVGDPPDNRSVETGVKYGVDIAAQRGRQFRAGDLDRFDMIFVMDHSNWKNIIRFAQSTDERSRVQMIMNMVEPGSNLDVPDPYWDDDGFEQVYHMLDEACERIIEKYAMVQL